MCVYILYLRIMYVLNIFTYSISIPGQYVTKWLSSSSVTYGWELDFSWHSKSSFPKREFLKASLFP